MKDEFKKTMSPFGIRVKNELILRNKTQNWLISVLKERLPNMYIDSSLIYRILTGDITGGKVIKEIHDILDIKEVQQTMVIDKCNANATDDSINIFNLKDIDELVHQAISNSYKNGGNLSVALELVDEAFSKLECPWIKNCVRETVIRWYIDSRPNEKLEVL